MHYATSPLPHRERGRDEGREIPFDISKISLREFRALIDPDRPDEEGDELLGRSDGLEGEKVADLPYPEYRKLTRAFFAKAREPLSDPN